MIGAPPPKFVMSKTEYKQHLGRLLVALVRKHGPMTVLALQERANQLIILYGVRDAWEFV